MLPVFQICFYFFQVNEQLFQAKQTRLSQSNYQEHEKYRVNNQATEIKDVLVDFKKCSQLIIVHQHAKGKVNPAHYSGVPRLSLDPCQLNSVVEIPNDKDAC